MIDSPESSAPANLNPNALSVADAARLLAKASGQPISVQMLEAALSAGAPKNPDGTISLVRYAAWLVRELSARD